MSPLVFFLLAAFCGPKIGAQIYSELSFGRKAQVCCLCILSSFASNVNVCKTWMDFCCM